MAKRSSIQLLASALMLGVAGYFVWSYLQENRDPTPQIYFYDLSDRKLFTGSQDAVPPIPGLDGEGEDGVRAIVFSPTGDCEGDRQIAYLEKYSPQLKGEFEAAKANPGQDLPRMSRSAAQGHTFVRRVDETTWHPVNTEEGGRIMGEWRTLHADKQPIICVP